MAYILALILLCLSGVAHAVDPIPYNMPADVAGYVKQPDGTFLRKVPRGGSRSASGSTITSKEIVPYQDRQGRSHNFAIQRSANVDKFDNRLGSAVVKVAKAFGPLSVALALADAVCNLSNICNIDDIWQIPGDPAYTDYPSSYPSSDGRWSPGSSSGITYPTPESACMDSGRNYSNPSLYAFHSLQFVNANTYNCNVKRLSDNATIFNGSTIRTINQCPTFYVNSNGNCVLQGNSEPRPATNEDFDNAIPALNDDQMIQPLVDGGYDVPVDVPTLTPDQKRRLGVDTTQLKDSQGNVTGTRETITEVEILDSATVDSPNTVILKETTTTINYDVNNQVIDSSTQTTYTQQPTPQTQTEPQEIKIEFDTVDPAELETYQIPSYIEGVSWGDGSCPPPIGLPLSIGYFEINTQPACDAAIFINPFMLLLAGIISIYIISGVRGGTQT